MTTNGTDARHDRLARSVAGLRRRQGVDLPRLLLVGGSVLIPTGLIVILLGWYGAAHTSYGFEQTPYLISGGILGAALTVAGGFLYFGYWLTRILDEGRRERRELTDLLARIDGRLAAVEAASVPAGDPAGNPVPHLVSTATGSLVHRRDCPLLAGKAGLRDVDPTSPDLKACRVCQPFGPRVPA